MKNNKTIVSLDETPYFTYYAALRIMIRGGSNPRQIRDFRFNSIEENNFWKGSFKNVSNQKQLLFYVFIDELRVLIQHSGLSGYDLDDSKIEEDIVVFSIRCMVLVGVIIENIGKSALDDFFGEFEENEAILSFISLSYVLFEEYKRKLFWKKSFLGLNNTYTIIDQYQDAEFPHILRKQSKKLLRALEDLERSELLSQFFSPRASILKYLPDFIPDKNKMLHVLYNDDFPLWGDIHEQGSLYSYYFSRNTLSSNSSLLMTHLENVRVYYMSDRFKRSKLKDSTMSFIIAESIDRKSESLDFADSETVEYAEHLFSSSKMQVIKTFFTKSINKKIITLQAETIKGIIQKETLATLKLFRETEHITDKKTREILALYFINIFEDINRHFVENAPLLFTQFNIKQKEELSIIISEIIKNELKDETELLEYLL